ncbi:relaxase domain-containing protein [Actinoplanes derwentensis]|uniref:TrwC relaxase n=1 Tax=Actinoplanes derwentensis TaxID=113562 RepID=A0A1H2DDH5_9ACTN|nr:relaxase domain-containing protein [Actinoplanes derwentensis]GID90092.1 hypothetical protein Ade03nite_90160 [Actinoplanes derwentensis]SDT80783.1 TrwC relaxase [Actinoplanes derwentensis]
MVWVTAVGPAGIPIEELLKRQFDHEPPDDDGELVVDRVEWFGEGLRECGLDPGSIVTDDQIAAVRALLNGCHPATGELLITVRKATDPRATLPAGPLVEALETGAKRIEGAGAAARFGRLQRGVARARARATQSGSHPEIGPPVFRAPIDDLASVARAAGVDLGDLYPAEVLALARDYARARVPAGIRGYDVILTLSEPTGALMATPAQDTAEMETAFTAAIRQAAEVLQQRAGYGSDSHHGRDGLTGRARTGLLGWTTVHRTACPAGGPEPVMGLHVHMTFVNMARRADGRWSTLGVNRRTIERLAGTADRALQQNLLQADRALWAERASGPRVRRFVEEWTDRLLDTGPLTDTERAEVVDAVRRCYEHAGVPWHGRVFWAPSPPAGQLLASARAWRHTALTTRIRQTGAVRIAGALFPALYGLGLTGLISGAALAVTLMIALPGDPLILADVMADRSAQNLNLHSLWISGTLSGMAMTIFIVRVSPVILDASRLRWLWESFAAAVLVAVSVILGLIFGSFPARLLPETGLPGEGWITTLLIGALALSFALFAALEVGARLRANPHTARFTDPVLERVDGHLGRRLKEISDAIPAAGPGQALVRAALDAAISDTYQQIELAIREATAERRMARRYPIGHLGSSPPHGPGTGWPAALGAATWTITAGVPAPGPAVTVVNDFAVTLRAGWWWPHTEFVVISERSTALRMTPSQARRRQP